MAASSGDAGTAGVIQGRYQLHEELGRGSMGVVHLARDLETGAMVAVKIMAPSGGCAPDALVEARERFLLGGEAAGRLKHPDIVTVLEAGQDRGRAYIAMELLKGRDLAHRTRPDNLLPLPLLLSIGARVAEALAYAHRLNVVHRDIKPGNILWDPASDSVKVTDFGIAQVADPGTNRSGVILGTPSYMSPEQLAAGPIDGRSDLYSLGVTLYHLACGRLPFEGGSMAELVYRIRNDPPASILRLRPDLPAGVVRVIYQAMMKIPEQRYRDGEEMGRALRECAATLAGTAR
ncbi:MAG TPA: serine/threonine-protein kinase [Burkholderiales bacterium]|nr:serine/threonine-protein kinase [Burkholderiales bacterium]